MLRRPDPARAPHGLRAGTVVESCCTTLLLACSPRARPPQAAAVWKPSPADRSVAGAGWIGNGCRGEADWARKGGRGRRGVGAIAWSQGRFSFSCGRKSPDLHAWRVTGAARDGRGEKTAPTEVARRAIDDRREAKTETLLRTKDHCVRTSLCLGLQERKPGLRFGLASSGDWDQNICMCSGSWQRSLGKDRGCVGVARDRTETGKTLHRAASA